MKRKLRIEELSVASFSTQEESMQVRGTVRGMADTSGQVTAVYGSCVAQYTCDGSCQLRSCAATCAATCALTCDDYSCHGTCVTC